MKNSEIIFRGKLISVYRGMKAMPYKGKSYFEEVRHPGAALMVPFKDGKLVFIRQYRAVIDQYIWELPAGGFSPGEIPVLCAKRELQEETGYVAGRTVKLGVIYTSPGFCDEKIHIFQTVCGKREPVKRDDNEVISVRLFSPDAVKKLFASGKITDSKTISALALAGVLGDKAFWVA